jgi:thiol:disulfide interchange protein DsbC
MKKVLFSIFIISLLLSLSYSQGYSEKESLSLGVDEALTLLKNLDPNIKVTAVKPSPIGGLWEVDIDAGGKKGLVYLDATKKYLISGAIIAIQEKKNLTQERLDEINKVDVSQIPLDDAVVIGDRQARYRVIVFDDPE